MYISVYTILYKYICMDMYVRTNVCKHTHVNSTSDMFSPKYGPLSSDVLQFMHATHATVSLISTAKSHFSTK